MIDGESGGFRNTGVPDGEGDSLLRSGGRRDDARKRRPPAAARGGSPRATRLRAAGPRGSSVRRRQPRSLIRVDCARHNDDERLGRRSAVVALARFDRRESRGEEVRRHGKHPGRQSVRVESVSHCSSRPVGGDTKPSQPPNEDISTAHATHPITLATPRRLSKTIDLTDTVRRGIFLLGQVARRTAVPMAASGVGCPIRVVAGVAHPREGLAGSTPNNSQSCQRDTVPPHLQKSDPGLWPVRVHSISRGGGA